MFNLQCAKVFCVLSCREIFKLKNILRSCCHHIITNVHPSVSSPVNLSICHSRNTCTEQHTHPCHRHLWLRSSPSSKRICSNLNVRQLWNSFSVYYSVPFLSLNFFLLADCIHCAMCMFVYYTLHTSGPDTRIGGIRVHCGDTRTRSHTCFEEIRVCLCRVLICVSCSQLL